MSSKATIPVLPERTNQSFSGGQFEFPHGWIYAAGKLWGSAQMQPGRAVRMDPDNLASYDIVTFAADGQHDRGLDIVYDGVVNNLIYVLHRYSFGNTVSSINPTTLATATPIADVDLSLANTNGSMAVTATHLFVGTASGPIGNPASNDAIILKYALTNYARTQVTLTDLKQCHCIRYDGTNLYASGLTSTGGNSWVAKINPDTLTYSSVLMPSGSGLPTDDLAFYGDYLYVGTEMANAGRIFKIAKSDLTITQIPVRPSTANFYGLFADSTHVWGVTPLVAGQGKMIRLDPLTLEQRLYTFNVGEAVDGPNEIAFISPYMFVTFFISDTKISRLRIPTA